MLFQLGGVQFVVAGMNPTAFDHDGSARHVEKGVLGRRPPLEFIGEGSDKIKIPVKVFDEVFGGMSSVERLWDQMLSGSAFPLMRGDGVALGWYVITDMSEGHKYLNEAGVGRVVDVDISLLRSSEASASASYLSQVFSFL